MISVILPVNRDDGFLEQAVNSILNQTYSSFELLIIANNCNNELWDKIQLIRKKDIRIQAHRLNLGGLVFALNYGLNIAKYEYIARMDADDIALSNRFKLQIDFLEKNPEIVILGTQIAYIDELNKERPIKASFLPVGSKDLCKISYLKCPLYHPTVMFRKTPIMKIGAYKYGFYGEDYELWLRCMHEGYNIANLEEILLKYRIHSSQLSNSSDRKNIYIHQMIGIFNKIYKEPKYLITMIINKSFTQKLIVKTTRFRKFLYGLLK